MDRMQHLLMTGASLVIFAIVNAAAHHLCDLRAFQIDACLYIDPASFPSGDDYTGLTCQCRQTCVSLVPYFALLGNGCCDDNLVNFAGNCRIISDARGSMLCFTGNESIGCHEGPTSKEIWVTSITHTTSNNPMIAVEVKLSKVFNDCKGHVKRGADTLCCHCASNYTGKSPLHQDCPLPTKYSGDSLGVPDQALTTCTIPQTLCSNTSMTTAAERPSSASDGALTGSIVASGGTSRTRVDLMIWLALGILALMVTMP